MRNNEILTLQNEAKNVFLSSVYLRLHLHWEWKPQFSVKYQGHLFMNVLTVRLTFF